jgi:hypothetical protein
MEAGLTDHVREIEEVLCARPVPPRLDGGGFSKLLLAPRWVSSCSGRPNAAVTLTSHCEQGIDLGYQGQELSRVLLNCGLAAELIPAFFCLIFHTATSTEESIMALPTNNG